ncbi:MAG: GNAT family N-acetyltransferase [Flavobacteriaceae bacterium]|nr:GNAT family N-acetyltransferase [Flavobacteriaceae bacterium]|tara:strand:+ start:942 stop:1682 length:741 start_codon:yes stop_codon:yes gene_type:complete
MAAKSADLFGTPVRDWVKPPVPHQTIWVDQMRGRHIRLEPLEVDCHAADLFSAFANDNENRIWDYLPYGPFTTLIELTDWINHRSTLKDPYFFAIVDQKSNRASGVASYLRVNPESGSIEVGHINFSPSLQSTIGATEAMYFMMRWAFLAGYRRYEWKCNALNLKSRRAAQRLGLSYEGIFRQATICKGRNRDTAWYAAIDAEWPVLKKAFESWLDESNFDPAGLQKQSLSDMTAPVLAMRDPALL